MVSIRRRRQIVKIAASPSFAAEVRSSSRRSPSGPEDAFTAAFSRVEINQFVTDHITLREISSNSSRVEQKLREGLRPRLRVQALPVRCKSCQILRHPVPVHRRDSRYFSPPPRAKNNHGDSGLIGDDEQTKARLAQFRQRCPGSGKNADHSTRCRYSFLRSVFHRPVKVARLNSIFEALSGKGRG